MTPFTMPLYLVSHSIFASSLLGEIINDVLSMANAGDQGPCQMVTA
jgi:hypothetical protein